MGKKREGQPSGLTRSLDCIKMKMNFNFKKRGFRENDSTSNLDFRRGTEEDEAAGGDLQHLS